MKRAENRRRWEQRLAAWQKSGLRLGEYCQRERLPARSMERWRLRLQREALAAGAQRERKPMASTALVPIELRELGALATLGRADPIEIRLRGGRAIVIQSEVTDVTLARLIGLVERAP